MLDQLIIPSPMIVDILLIIVLCMIVVQFRHARYQRKRIEKVLSDFRTMLLTNLSHKRLQTLDGSENFKTLSTNIVKLLSEKKIRFFKNTLPERIGHLALETDLWLKELYLNGHQDYHCGIIVTPESVANPHLLSYWNDCFEFRISLSDWEALEALIPEIKSLMSVRHDYGVAYLETATLYDIYKQWADSPPLLNLRKEDQEHARQTMREWGMGEHDWFVCFHNREPGYAPHDDEYHTYRNAAIETFFPAMREVVAQGGWVVRMGDPSMTPLPTMERVIDYAHSAQRTARMDVILCASAKAFIGNTSGLFIVSTIFGVPVASVNFAPMSAMQYTFRDISIPKLLYSDKKKRLLTFQEVLDSPLANYRYASHFEAEHVRVIDNTEDEIANLVREMLERSTGSCEYTEEDENLQKAFFSLIKNGHYGYGSAARIGRDFLRKHKELLPAI